MATAWEREVASLNNVFEPVGSQLESSEGPSFDYDNPGAEVALEEAANMLIDLKLQAGISARQVCTLCWWLSKAGLGGKIADLSVHPDRASGQYSKHFDYVVGVRAVDVREDFVIVKMPMHERSMAKRSVREVAVFTPLEAIAEEIAATPDMHAKLDASIANGELPASYFNHIVKRSAPNGVLVYPCLLYVDGLGFTRTDGLIRFTVKCLITNVNHLCMALRKSELCACGCRGWCTLYVAMLVLDWSFKAMARGEFYRRRHDGQAWSSSDWRFEKAGKPLGWRSMILFCRCDMMEHSTSFGFPGHGSHTAPCPGCFCTIDDMYSIVGVSPVRLPWRLKTLDAYLESCAACEHICVVTPEQRRHIRMLLRYDKRDTGSRGRALRVGIPELGLRAGDRLEPQPTMPDVGAAVDNNSTTHVRLVFWRCSQETITHRRNPLFSKETGITPDIFVPDWLHGLSLGCYKRWIAFVWRILFEVNVFGVDRVNASTVEAYHGTCVVFLKEQLFQWYADENASGRQHARVQNLTPGMVEPTDLGTWGAETNGLLLFTHHFLGKYGACIEDLQQRQRVERATASLVAIHRLIKAHKKGQMQPPQIQEFADEWKTHMQMIKLLGAEQTPKHHQMAHMIRKLLTCGNPHMWSTWKDESENHELGKLALAAHRSVWSWRVLANHRRSYGVRRAKRVKYSS